MSGRVTKAEARQYQRIVELSDRRDAVVARFEAHGLEVDDEIVKLTPTMDQAEAILDRLDAAKGASVVEIERVLKRVRPVMRRWLGEGQRGYDAADELAQAIAAGIEDVFGKADPEREGGS